VDCRSLGSENLRCERNDLHERTLTKFTSHRAEDPGTTWVVVLVDDHNSVGIETEDRTISTTDRVSGANDNSLDDTALFDSSGRDGIANVAGDHITNRGGAAALAEHADHFCATGAGIIGDGEHGFHLDHDSKIGTGEKS